MLPPPRDRDSCTLSLQPHQTWDLQPRNTRALGVVRTPSPGRQRDGGSQGCQAGPGRPGPPVPMTTQPNPLTPAPYSPTGGAHVHGLLVHLPFASTLSPCCCSSHAGCGACSWLRRRSRVALSAPVGSWLTSLHPRPLAVHLAVGWAPIHRALLTPGAAYLFGHSELGGQNVAVTFRSSATTALSPGHVAVTGGGRCVQGRFLSALGGWAEAKPLGDLMGNPWDLGWGLQAADPKANGDMPGVEALPGTPRGLGAELGGPRPAQG